MKQRFDKHHLLWCRRDWRTGYAHALREHWYLRMVIPKNTLHARIHESIANIPVPTGVSAREAYTQLMNLETYGAIHKNDPIEKRLKLLIALFDCQEPETAYALKQQLRIVQEYNNKKAPH